MRLTVQCGWQEAGGEEERTIAHYGGRGAQTISKQYFFFLITTGVESKSSRRGDLGMR